MLSANENKDKAECVIVKAFRCFAVICISKVFSYRRYRTKLKGKLNEVIMKVIVTYYPEALVFNELYIDI